MKWAIYIAFVTFFLGHSFIEVRAASKCYSCSTSMDQYCNDPFTNSTQQICSSLDNKSYNCIKYSYTREEQIIIYRSCKSTDITCDGLKETFNVENRKLLKCDICSGDLCNSAQQTCNLTALILLIGICLVGTIFSL